MKISEEQSNAILAATAELPTPFLVVQEEILHRNISRIHDYAEQHGLTVRPHVKTHKSLAIANIQKDAGAVGIAVAKASEAEAMAPACRGDITVAYPVLGHHSATRLAKLASTRKIRIAVDSFQAIDDLSAAAEEFKTTLGIMVIVDAGLHRCGVTQPAEAMALARYVEKSPGLCFDGVQLYLGHLYGETVLNPETFEPIRHKLETVCTLLCREKIRPVCVSSGSTPSLFSTHLLPQVNEIRVGTAYLNDYFVLKFGHCTLDQCAARVVTKVISNVTPGQVIVDAGSKALSAKQLLRHENLEMGFIPEYPQARIFRLHEEHGWVDVSRCQQPPRLGERITVVPVNIALCMNLFNDFHLFSETGAVRRERVDARGCLA